MFELNDEDRRDFNAAQERIWMLIRDGEWHTATAIETVASPYPGRRARSGLRRLREVRATVSEYGIQIECRRCLTEGGRESEYRCVRRPELPVTQHLLFLP